MMLDDSRRKESLVHWIDPAAGRLFWTLHKLYMRTVRLHIGDTHPYYLVAQRADAFGEPLKLKRLHAQFYRCAIRAGFRTRTDGVAPHGCRHFYGYFSANWLKLSKERVQKMMHHASPLSTDVYYRLDNLVLRDELAAAHERMAKALPAFMQGKQLLTADSEDQDDGR
jgi:integrase